MKSFKSPKLKTKQNKTKNKKPLCLKHFNGLHGKRIFIKAVSCSLYLENNFSKHPPFITPIIHCGSFLEYTTPHSFILQVCTNTLYIIFGKYHPSSTFLVYIPTGSLLEDNILPHHPLVLSCLILCGSLLQIPSKHIFHLSLLSLTTVAYSLQSL